MAKELRQYNKKRDFEKTGEPEGKVEESGKGGNKGKVLSFAVQRHIASRDHYDFRLEWKGALLSWAVPKGPSYNPADKRLAVQVEDHPVTYRNFEGTIPKGQYGGGTVMLWDEGDWEPEGGVEKGLSEGSLKFNLNGIRLKGKWALVRLKDKEGVFKENWILLKEKDKYAQDGDGISDYTVSVRTGRTMQEIERGEDEKVVKNPMESVNVQLAKLAAAPPGGDGWLFELKYDGYRIIAFVEGNKAKLITRNRNDFTGRFKGIAPALAGWAAGRAMVLDGEMVITDENGRTDFQALQNHMKKPGDKKLTYIVFDILALNGEDLRGYPLIRRKEILDKLMQDAPENLYCSKYVKGKGRESLNAACKLNLEGIVGKKIDSVYSGSRSGGWIKVKCGSRQEFVVGGYTLSDKKTEGISSLLLGVYKGGNLIFSGRAGTGFTQRLQKELREKFDNIKIEDAPFANPPSPEKNEKFTWLKPLTVAEIKFSEWTKDNLLRQASFKGLRTDKNPKDVVMEKADTDTSDEEQKKEDEKKPAENGKTITVLGITITNPNKVIFTEPEIKKADIVRYYEKVSGLMLPYIENRILSIVRCPKGISQPCFFKKHPVGESKGITLVPVTTSGGEKDFYFYIEDVSGLISEAQMGTLEFHIWGSRAGTLEKPDMMVFDLDPDEGMDLKQVRQGVKDLKSVLDRLSLSSYLKTSGGKGYHVVIPLKPSAGWDVFNDFSRRIAEVMEKNWPDLYTSNIRKEKRKGKIFIDWQRNGRGATSIAPYSVRAKKGAGVSMPIAWKELGTVSPGGINMEEALARVKSGDPWKDFFKTGQELK